MAKLQVLTMETLADALAEKARRKAASWQQAQPRRSCSSNRPTHIGDSITRDCTLRRIRFLAKCYGLHWLIEQESFGLLGAEDLQEAELFALLERMERARECIQEGVSFEDAGLIRNTADSLQAS